MVRHRQPRSWVPVAVALAAAVVAGCGSSASRMGSGLSAGGGVTLSSDTGSSGAAGSETTAPGSASTTVAGTVAGTGTGTAGTATASTASVSSGTTTGATVATTAGKSTTSTTEPAASGTTTTAAVATTAFTGGSGVYGTVTAGPTCPVERVDNPCPPKPVSAEVDADASDGRTVASTHSGSDGQYQLALEPGSYRLVVVTGSTYPRCNPVDVTVDRGTPARADISCDTGIR